MRRCAASVFIMLAGRYPFYSTFFNIVVLIFHRVGSGPSAVTASGFLIDLRDCSCSLISFHAPPCHLVARVKRVGCEQSQAILPSSDSLITRRVVLPRLVGRSTADRARDQSPARAWHRPPPRRNRPACVSWAAYCDGRQSRGGREVRAKRRESWLFASSVPRKTSFAPFSPNVVPRHTSDSVIFELARRCFKSARDEAWPSSKF